MKKSCDGCMAYSRTGCALGYKTETYFKTEFKIKFQKPLQECEKPKTYSKLLILLGTKS